MGALDYVLAGVIEALTGNPALTLGPLVLSWPVLMVSAGFFTGVLIGATPGLSGPFAMALALPLLISSFGFSHDALLPVIGFLIGIMKGATVGGAVPAILFNTPGTPDAFMTTLDGYPMAQKGQGGKALRVAQFASVTGDTFSDIVLFLCAPFLAISIELFLGLSEKASLMILSLSFVAVVVGSDAFKGLLAASLGLLVASVGSGTDPYPRLSLGMDFLASGLPTIAVIIGILVVGEIFGSLAEMRRHARATGQAEIIRDTGDNSLGLAERIRLLPFIGMSMTIGTLIGALPGIGSTLAAAMGYTAGRKIHKGAVPFGEGAPEGIASCEAANSAVSGANLIPALSLGIPGNVSAVFIILAANSIGGFNPGPSVFRFTQDQVNPELVIAFGLFTLMVVGNLLNWTTGAWFMRLLGGLIRVPRQILLPVVLLLTITSVYVEGGSMVDVYILLVFGFIGYLMRWAHVPILPFVIAYILALPLESTIRNAFEASGGDPYFLFHGVVSPALLFLSVVIFAASGWLRRGKPSD
ncbi:tripartite tricarboxylate transporter permease [Paracoccus seriniphilus]|uniref:Putative tricarboxylic transport membrane protein n=1 Tax=Paracoccus seriniphilus TaxID=184748 RepID=A0A239PZR8_9RHOB|nr:tripartite tricarboxylate transporter permease [Paracoccus seriniphilus]WCR16305.1 tripartite tricarboxylate transporter permease [Paracoccus seriniphilus]SNT75849.1 putative tricarboxylic transport membrane protein [Paracoccus seriniphilus]